MEIFREQNHLGRLIHVEPNASNQYIAHVWFDYSLKLMQNLKEGDFIAVESFASNPDGRRHYVILEVVKKLPIHFALVQSVENAKRTYPGFLMESAKSASLDWISQIDESTEETTKIVCEAIPINLGFYITESGVEGPSQSYELPMPGREVKVISYEFMEKILNKGLDKKETVVEVGHLRENSNVKILLDVESLLRLHFGVFGFTGAGKSNLLSTLISKIMEKSPSGTKVIVFDIMGEYLTLLIDLLYKYPDSKVIGVGAETFIQDLYSYYDGNRDLKTAVKSIVITNLYPKRLARKDVKRKFLYPVKKLVERKAFKVFEFGRFKLIEEVFEEAGLNAINISAKDREIILEILNSYKGRLAYEVTADVVKEINSKLTSGKANTEKFKRELLRLLKPPKFHVNEDLFISLEAGWLQELNDKDKKAIYVVQSHDPDSLKRFVSYLASAVYESRRREGRIFPLISFILDEADEYIPQDTYAKGDSKISREAVEMLARRGRKFGLGVGIATQRVVYLDTNIMAQPHTYFVSKLPRSTDRERVAQAFAVDESMFEQTFRFGKGDWLLMSHDATGLESVPFPIHTENAEDRIITFLESFEK